MFLFDLFATLLLNLLLWAWVWLIPTRVILVSRLWIKGAQAMAFPGFILICQNAFNERVLRHEFAHIEQMRRYSPAGVALLLAFGYVRLFVQHLLRERPHGGSDLAHPAVQGGHQRDGRRA